MSSCDKQLYFYNFNRFRDTAIVQCKIGTFYTPLSSKPRGKKTVASIFAIFFLQPAYHNIT